MHDISLWHLLPPPLLEGDHLDQHATEIECDARSKRLAEWVASDWDALRIRLQGLSEKSLSERYPYLARIEWLIGSTQVPDQVKAEAIRCWKGMSGLSAWQRVLELTEDPSPVVSDAAADTFLSFIPRAEWLQLHMLFHREPTARERSLQHLLKNSSEPLSRSLLYLLGAPEGCPPVRQALTERRFELTIELADKLRQLGLLSEEGVLHQLSMQDRHSFLNTFRQEVRPSDEIVSHLLKAFADANESALVFDSYRDSLLVLLRYLWKRDESQSDVPFQTLFRFLEEILHDGTSQYVRRRYLVACLILHRETGQWNEPLLGLCLRFYPTLLFVSQLSVELQKRLAISLYESRSIPIVQTPPKVLRRLFQTPPAAMEGWGLDLEYIGALFQFASIDPYELLLEIYPLDQVVNSFLVRIESSLRFFDYSHSSKSRKRILKAVQQARGEGATSIDALLILHIPTLAAALVEHQSVLGREAILLELLQLSTSQEKRLGERKAAVVVPLLIHDFAEPQFERVFQIIMDTLPAVRPTYLGLEFLIGAANALGAERFVSMVLEWSTESIRALLEWIPNAAGFPYGCECYLASILIDHPDHAIREWAVVRTIAVDKSEKEPDLHTVDGSTVPQPISDELAERLLAVDESLLAMVALPLVDKPVTGLCELLSRRPLPTVSNVTICAALLHCGDSREEIDHWFHLYSAESSFFAKELDRILVDRALYNRGGSVFLNAWLFRWEHHAFRFADQLLIDTSSIRDCIEYSRTVVSPILRSHLWQTMYRVMMIWSYRDRVKFERFFHNEVMERIIPELSQPDGPWAAKVLLRMWESGISRTSVESMRGHCQVRMLQASSEVQSILQPWIDTRGLAAGMERSSLLLLDVSGEAIAQIDSLDVLGEICHSKDKDAVSQAVCRLLELGDAGCEVLSRLLWKDSMVPHVSLVAESVSYWPSEMQSTLIPFVSEKRFSSMLRFLVGSQLVELGYSELHEAVLETVLEPTTIAWFQIQDVRRLLMLRYSMVDLAAKLIASPHPQAYLWAIDTWKSIDSYSSDTLRRKTNALKRFLSLGSIRSHDARLDVATELLRCEDHFGVPLLIQHAAEQSEYELPFEETPLLNETIRCGELAGEAVLSEERVYEFFARWRTDQPTETLAAVSLRLARSLRSSKIRDWISLSWRDTDAQMRKIGSVADTFAWGIHEAQKLTGNRFTIHVLGGDDLGYTKLTEKSVYINPLAILNGARNGRAVVEGLILHEIGHHMYHAGTENLKVWEKASKDGVQELLNLVLDEHLERNLRAIDVDYGDRLKRLGAYAFQHTRTDISIFHLLEALGVENAFSVLIKNRMMISRRDGCVQIGSGEILQAAERHGKSFIRFFRALRMGLGNRHNDPKVEQGLELFRGDFRRSSMQELDRIARRLQEIFGEETRCLQQFGFEVVLADRDGQLCIDGLGLDDMQVQNEIVRITSKPTRSSRGSGGVRAINVGEDVGFDKIHRIERLHGDAERYRTMCQLVAKEARQFRQFLDGLGLQMVNQNRRLRGNRLDRPRLTGLVTTRDPRILKMRETKWETDLFLGILIDCSGSMQHDDNIEKAKLFGTLLSEAARGLATVDVRILGFTDSTIYDCGGSGSPGISALKSEGGNNDAAGLWYASQLAIRSKRKAKLLVMISDGLPTECSTQALRRLVKSLTLRSNIVCAQIAVQPLEEVCFENYVCLDTSNTSQCVRDFGKTLTGLVRKAMV